MDLSRFNWKSKYGGIISVIYTNIAPHIRSWKWLAKLIFNVDAYSKHRYSKWDLCSLVSKKALDIYSKENQRILEIGPSDVGILCMYLARKFKNIDVTGADISADFLENATLNARLNNLKINYIQSNLFSNVEGTFDIIFFNPPYNAREWGKKHIKVSLEKNATNIWDGGEDSHDIIRRFLNEASAYLSPNGKVLMGTTSFFQEASTLKEIIDESDLELTNIVSGTLNPANVYVLVKKA